MKWAMLMLVALVGACSIARPPADALRVDTDAGDASAEQGNDDADDQADVVGGDQDSGVAADPVVAGDAEAGPDEPVVEPEPEEPELGFPPDLKWVPGLWKVNLVALPGSCKEGEGLIGSETWRLTFDDVGLVVKRDDASDFTLLRYAWGFEGHLVGTDRISVMFDESHRRMRGSRDPYVNCRVVLDGDRLGDL